MSRSLLQKLGRFMQSRKSPRHRKPGLRVSLTMIVRDKEDNLPRCLESARTLR